MILPIPPDSRHRRYTLAALLATAFAIVGVVVAFGPWRSVEPPRHGWSPERPYGSLSTPVPKAAAPAPVPVEPPAPPPARVVVTPETRPEQTPSSPPPPAVERAPVAREPAGTAPQDATAPPSSAVAPPPIEPPPPPPQPPRGFGGGEAVPPAPASVPAPSPPPPPVATPSTEPMAPTPSTPAPSVAVWMPMQRLVTAAMRAVVTVRSGAAARGAGFIVDQGGYIVTTNRVLGETSRLEVTLSGGRTLPVTAIGRDLVSDVAVLKVEATGLPVIPLGSSSAVRVGEPVLALSPGPPAVATISVTGLATGGNLVVDVPLGRDRTGGPVLNARGEAVGVAGGTGAAIHGIAVPIDRAKPILADMKAATARRTPGR